MAVTIPSPRLAFPALFFLFLLTAIPHTASAALRADSYTDSERVGFGFARLTGTTPDFVAWITGDEEWQKASPASRDRIMASELTRLKEGLASYEPKIDFIHANVRVSVTWTADDLQDPGPHDIHIAFKPPGAIFSYAIGDRRIDMLPEQMEDALALSLTPEEFADFIKCVGKGGGLDGIFEFYMQPIAADASTPMMVHGTAVWPMITRVAHITLWSTNHRSTIWEYDAPWYKQQLASKILGLYDH